MNTCTSLHRKLTVTQTDTKRLCVQFALLSTQPSFTLGFCLLSICTPSPQQPQQNTTGVEPNPSWHIFIPQTHTPPCNILQLPISSFQSLLTCRAPAPVHHSSHPRLSIRCSESSSRFLPVSPSLCFSNPPSLSVLLSSSTCGGNSLFNSLQHQPINSFADGWLAPAGAG